MSGKLSKPTPLEAALDELIAAPLIATMRADFWSVQAFIDVVTRLCFEPGITPGRGVEHWGRARVVTFEFVRTDLKGRQVPTKVRIPLISMVPLPLQGRALKLMQRSHSA